MVFTGLMTQPTVRGETVVPCMNDLPIQVKLTGKMHPDSVMNNKGESECTCTKPMTDCHHLPPGGIIVYKDTVPLAVKPWYCD